MDDQPTPRDTAFRLISVKKASWDQPATWSDSVPVPDEMSVIRELVNIANVLMELREDENGTPVSESMNEVEQLLEGMDRRRDDLA